MKALVHLALIMALALPMLGARADTLDDFVHQELQRQDIPGAAVGIFHNGQPLLLKGFGLADLEQGVPVHADTLFQSGSIGKMFTAAGVMLLVENGLIELDTSIRTYLPEAPKSWQAITPRHLLNHTAGLGGTAFDLQRDYSDEEYLKKYFDSPLAFPAGERWAYSNPGYAVLGLLINRVTGQHYGALLKERLFGPASMQTARVISDRAIIPHRASGYERDDEGLKNQQWVAASHNAAAEGSLYLSLLDYAAWDAVVARRGVLSAESWQEILRPAQLSGGASHPYGFGWDVAKTPEGRSFIGHGGAWQGFATLMRRFDNEGLTFVVLTNARHADVRSILDGVVLRFDAQRAPRP